MVIGPWFRHLQSCCTVLNQNFGIKQKDVRLSGHDGLVALGMLRDERVHELAPIGPIYRTNYRNFFQLVLAVGVLPS